MDTKDYDQIIKDVSDKIAKAFIAKERDLNGRILSVDADIAKITQSIGQEVTEQVIKEVLAQHVLKKNSKGR